MAQDSDAQQPPPGRRSSEENRRQATRRDAARSLSPEAAPFLALAAKRFRVMQQAAETTVEDLTNALESLTSQMSSHEDEEIKRVRSIGEALITQAKVVSDRCQRTREWLEESGGEAPSKGVALIAGQMAFAGAPESEIENVLLEFGVGDPEEAVARALRDSGR